MTESDVQRKFHAALETLVEKLKQDRYILAVILAGSLAWDQVWEKSDVDLFLITTDDRAMERKKGKECAFALLEDGVNFHVYLHTRGEFKRLLDSSVQSSFFHSMMSLSKLVYTKDDTIAAWFRDMRRLGSRDKQVQLLRAANHTLPTLYKAEKWLHVKSDIHYSYLWILSSMYSLATIEVLRHDEISGREAILQALELNPEFFRPLVTTLMDSKKTPKNVRAALVSISDYLEGMIDLLFQPILDYLADAQAPRSVTEIETYFKNQMDIDGIATSCEWLADKGVIAKVSTPVRLTVKSQITVDEMAFYYDRNERYG